METDGSDCPEGGNSTDCLLRTLLHLVRGQRQADDAETNWDPITFWLTLVIETGGDERSGLQIVAKASRILRTFGAKLTTTFHTLLYPRREKPSAATWAGFFNQLGLTEVNPQEDKSGLRQTVADYLPDDLIAAPAYAQFGVIIASAAAAGARFQYIEGEARYPIILGRDFQFEFRQHPILGTFGAYSQHLMLDSKPGVPEPEELLMAMEHARGSFRTQCCFDIDEDNYVFRGHDREFSDDIAFGVTQCMSTVVETTARVQELSYTAEEKDANAHRAKLALEEAVDTDREELETERAKADEEATEARKRLAGQQAALRRAEDELREHTHGFHGHLLVLIMCINYLNNPEKFLSWFFDNTPEVQRYWRWIVRREQKELDRWLGQRTTEYVTNRIDIIRNTTVVLLNAASANDGISKGQNLYLWPVRSHPGNVAVWRMAEFKPDLSDIGSMQAKIKKCGDQLEGLIGPVNFEPRGLIEMYRFMEVLAEIVTDQSVAKEPKERSENVTVGQDEEGEGENGKPQSPNLIGETVTRTGEENEEDAGDEEAGEERVGKEEVNKQEVDRKQYTDEERAQTDEVIIYRYLTAAVLFRTAHDSSRMLNSGLWDHIVPII
ncbi:hypothetical protein CSOJ01_11690 [Colletotrichum sojae]|uniref:Uncharacterized protein n=1 Tax=Colletotrichum sojae TaxID=2175907 RepID=A0A8H6IWP5_9PEZI|nr:hypothetical protein CSOJ01_11690 [Colletotrichum sojae]